MVRCTTGMVTLAVVLGWGLLADADYYDGLRAADAGRYDEALRKWQEAANAGEAKAMLALGRLYVQGVGAPQNYVQAHMWFSLAASRGEKEAVAERDELAEKMTPGQVAEAQERTAAWQPGETHPTLHRAAQAGTMDGLEAALDAGADVNARDGRGWTALMYVVDKGYVLLVEPLVQAQADLNLRAPDGATALFIATAHGHSEIIAMLMKAGADPMIKGARGKTATEVAQARYGDPAAARAQGEDDAVIALLQGQTWAQFEAAEAAEEAARDEAAFARADSLWTVDAYADYLASYPSGRHVEKARRRQAALERESPLTATSPAGTTIRECADCPEIVVIPAGRFRMGDLNGDGFSFERPVHEVTIAAPFAVGVYEVTRSEFERFVEATGYTTRNFCWTFEDGEMKERSGRDWRAPGYTQTGQHPVVCVNWNDAQAYVRWLSREVGKPYRLLSEAEWEYVARAGTETIYWWGGDSWLDDSPRDYANYGSDECCGGKAAGADRWVNTAPVGSFKANPFGVFDTAGNVWEWVEDCWNDSYRGAPNDGSAWEREECGVRVFRGGSWSYSPGYLRTAFRNRYVTGVRYYNSGVRVARTLD